MQPTTQAALTAWEASLCAMRDSLGDLLRQVESEVWSVPGPADHMQQVLSDDIIRLNGLLAEKDQAIQDLERLREGQARRIADLIQHRVWQQQEIEALQRRIVAQSDTVREKDREIERIGGLNAWQAEQITRLSQEDDAPRQRAKTAEAEVERLAAAIKEKDAEIDRCRGVIVEKSEEMRSRSGKEEARRLGLLAAKLDMERLSTMLDEKEREIEQFTQQADDQRRQHKLAEAEVERLTEALRQSNYQRDNAIADKTIAQAVATKAWEEAGRLRQHVQELRRHVKID